MSENDLNRAIGLNKSGNNIEARKILEQIVHDDPQNETAWLWLADTYPDKPNRYVILQECLRHNPNSSNAQKWLSTVNFDNDLSGVIDLIKTGRKVDTRPILEHIVHDDPHNDTAWIWLADTYSETPDRIHVLEECLKFNPDSHIAQRWLTTLNAEETTLPGTTQPDVPILTTDQSEQTQSIVGESAESGQYPAEKKAGREKKNSRMFITLAVIFGIILLGVIGFFGIARLQRQGILPGSMKRETITSIPTAFRVPSATITLTATLIPKTPTPTFTPTRTLSASSTLPPVNSTTPGTFTPMPALAQQARAVSISLGFKPQSNECGQTTACQAYLSEIPYLLIVVMDNGVVTISLDETTLAGQNSTPTSASIIPYGTQLLWYEYVIADIYNSFSPDFWKDISVVVERTRTYGSYDWVSYFGYRISGTQSADHKIVLTITPP